MIAELKTSPRSIVSTAYTLTVKACELRCLLPILAAGDWPGEAIEDRPELQGIRVEVAPGQTMLVASNGHQLAAVQSEAIWPAKAWKDRAPVQFTLPLSCLTWLNRHECQQAHLTYDAANEMVGVRYDDDAVFKSELSGESFKWRHLVREAKLSQCPDHSINLAQMSLWRQVFTLLGINSPAIIHARMVDLTLQSGALAPAALISPCHGLEAQRITGIQMLNQADSDFQSPTWI